MEKLVFYIISIENLIFWHENTNRVLHYSEKLVFFMIFIENLIFPTDTPNGSKLSLEKGYFIKIYISMKHTERYGIQVKNLVFFSVISVKSVNF